MYLYNTYSGGSGWVTNLFKAVNSVNVTNTPETFGGGTTWIGGYNNDNSLTFDGSIDEVAVFTNALAEGLIQNMFLRAIGLTTGIPPALTTPPTNATVFTGQTLQLSTTASGVPPPNYQWQYINNGNATNVPNNPAVGISSPFNSTLYYTNFTGNWTNFRAIATNIYGKATSGVAVVTVLPVANWNKGLWTVNFSVPSANNSGPNTPYVGRGVLGTGTYWNALSGSQFANTPPSLLDNGATHCPVNVGATNYPSSFASTAPYNSLLLDQYMQIGTGGTSMLFTGVPIGRYNLALYGTCGSWANRGTTFTVQGVSQSVTNAQDAFLLPDNTVIYTNLVVTNGTLEVHMTPGWTLAQGSTNTEGDFNGAQLELLTYGPNILSVTNRNGTNVLTYAGGMLLSSTNSVTGPWITNVGNPYLYFPTGQMRFFKVYTNAF